MHVRRNSAGEIVAASRWPEHDLSGNVMTEPLPDDHPDVVAFLAVPPLAPSWTPLEFMERFTKVERTAIRTAAKSSDDLADWLDLLRASTLVKSDDERTIAGMADLVTAGLITEARRVKILTP